jgi:hypothetical protein
VMMLTGKRLGRHVRRRGNRRQWEANRYRQMCDDAQPNQRKPESGSKSGWNDFWAHRPIRRPTARSSS